MKTYKKITASFDITTSATKDNVLIVAMHSYEKSDNESEVTLFEIKSDSDPFQLEFSEIENFLADHKIEVEINEQDGAWFHGNIIK